MLCPSCGQSNLKNVQSCVHCGAQMKSAPPAAVVGELEAAWDLKQRGQARLLGIVIAAVVVLLLLVVCVAAVAFLVIPRLSGGDQILLASPSRNGDAELYLLKLGQDEADGVLLAEDVEWTATSFWSLKGGRYHRFGEYYGGFVPNSNHLLLWYKFEGDTVVQQIRVGDKEPAAVIKSGEEIEQVSVVNDFQSVFLQELRDGEMRCYVAQPGGEAQRVAKANRCEIVWDGSMVYSSDVARNETTLSVVGLRGENETAVLDGVEGIESYQVSSDASHVAYARTDNGDLQLYLVERSSGNETEIGDKAFDIADYGFGFGSDVLYYVVKENRSDQDVQLYTSEGSRPIAEGVEIEATFSADSRSLAYVVEDDDGERTLYVHPMGGGSDVEVAQGKEITYHFLETAPPRLVAVAIEEDGEFRVISVNPDGGGAVELLNEDDATYESLDSIPGEPALYIWMRESSQDVLFVTPVDKATGFRLLEEWASANLLNRSPGGSRLVFWAQENAGDDPVLYSVAVQEGARPVKLDDGGVSFFDAVFTTDGRFVLYTAITGPDDDDVEIRRVPADGSAKFETVYDKAALIDVQWDDISPFSWPQ